MTSAPATNAWFSPMSLFHVESPYLRRMFCLCDLENATALVSSFRAPGGVGSSVSSSGPV